MYVEEIIHYYSTCFSLPGSGYIQVFGGAETAKDASRSDGWTVQICIQCHNSVHWKSKAHLVLHGIYI